MNIQLLLFLLTPLLLGFISGYFSQSGNTEWYKSLKKPKWNPPSWLFGPVWSILYLMMGYASYRIYEKTKNPLPLIIYTIQLTLNILWTPVFFRFHKIKLALIIIGLLWLSIITTIFYFNKYDRIAALLLVPYILWVTFASSLNGTILYLNK